MRFRGRHETRPGRATAAAIHITPAPAMRRCGTRRALHDPLPHKPAVHGPILSCCVLRCRAAPVLRRPTAAKSLRESRQAMRAAPRYPCASPACQTESHESRADLCKCCAARAAMRCICVAQSALHARHLKVPRRLSPARQDCINPLRQAAEPRAARHRYSATAGGSAGCRRPVRTHAPPIR